MERDAVSEITTDHRGEWRIGGMLATACFIACVEMPGECANGFCASLCCICSEGLCCCCES